MCVCVCVCVCGKREYKQNNRFIDVFQRRIYHDLTPDFVIMNMLVVYFS